MSHDSSVFSTHISTDHTPPADRTVSIDCTTARFLDLRKVAGLQRRAFPARLAYGLGTLLVLWALPSVRFIIASDGDEIVGCAIGDQSGGHSRVVNICVDPVRQGGGIGTDLLRRLDEELPVGNLVLMVQEENEAAKALYLKEGFEQMSVSHGYYGKGRNGIWMEKIRTASPSQKNRV